MKICPVGVELFHADKWSERQTFSSVCYFIIRKLNTFNVIRLVMVQLP